VLKIAKHWGSEEMRGHEEPISKNLKTGSIFPRDLDWINQRKFLQKIFVWEKSNVKL